jgi:uncharacterized Tic20 family protein
MTGHPPEGPPPGPPPGPPAGPPPYGAAQPLRPDEERLWATLGHLGALLLGVVAPLVVYLVFKDRSRWVADTSREALNFNISYLLYLLVAGAMMLVLVGFLVFPVVLVAYYVFVIIGGVKTANGELYRFPLIFRLVT